jgi:hypothetical protein
MKGKFQVLPILKFNFKQQLERQKIPNCMAASIPLIYED